MPRMATEPLTKVTLNLFEADVEWFKARFGQGYSERIREVVHEHAKQTRNEESRFEDWFKVKP